MPGALLLGCHGLAKAHGARPLFEDLSLDLFEGDHAGLVGPNGAGKSTLLRILAGLEDPDRGTRALRSGVRVGYVPQDPAFPAGETVEDVVAAALDGVDEADRPARLALALGRAGFADPRAAVAALSGGWRKRLAIACALAAEPDVLLMDEPTNHLDLDGILWLEALLAAEARAVLVVSHDRYFLEHVANRMLELSPVHAGGLFACDGPYSEFLARRDERLRGQAAYEESLADAVRREIAWLRRGAKARSTKARARVAGAGRLVEALEEARARAAAPAADIGFASTARRTRRLLVARDLVKSLDGHPVVDGLDLAIGPGTRVGVIGPNGSGKTTVLRLLAGSLAPDAGTVERTEGLRLVHFEQHRPGLDPAVPLRRALAPEGDQVIVRGRAVHVAAWAKRFLFRPEQLDVPVGRLSGGEQARVLIARLVREPADLLLLDEPTNDLDIPTLEVLEEALVEFDGGIVLVTHDRFLLERVSTAILALDGTGRAETFADLAQWQAARDARAAAGRGAAAPAPGGRARADAARGDGNGGAAGHAGAARGAAGHSAAAHARGGGGDGAPGEGGAGDGGRGRRQPARRLTYREQREWDGMEAAIVGAEAEVEACRRAVEDPAVASDAAALQARCAALEAAQAEVDQLYARWAELEAKRSPA